MNQKRKEPKQERSKDTVDSILQAVVELVHQDADKGFGKELNTTRIAERAGVSIGSLYQYFPGKEAIFSGLIEWSLRKEVELITAALSSIKDKSLEDAVSSMVDAVLKIRKRNLKIEGALLRFFSRTGDFHILNKYDAELIQKVDEALTLLSESGQIQKTNSTAFILVHSMRSVFLATTIQRASFYEDPEFSAQVKRMVLGQLALK